MLEYRVVIATGETETHQDHPVQLLADSLEAAEKGALSLFESLPHARVVMSGLVDRTPEPATQPKPSVGRIVHLVRNDGKALAAIITDVHKDAGVELTVFLPGALPGYVEGVIPFSETPKRGHWNWPPRA